MNFKNLILILYAIMGAALIIMGLFKKIQVFEGEKIEKLGELQIINTLTSIIFGSIFIFESYLCYLGKIHWIFLIFSVILVEVFQQTLFKVYIKEDIENNIQTKTTKLSEDIKLDEILEEDFFEQKKEVEKEEKEKEEYLQLRKEEEEKSKKILQDLIKEGIELGILD